MEFNPKPAMNETAGSALTAIVDATIASMVASGLSLTRSKEGLAKAAEELANATEELAKATENNRRLSQLLSLNEVNSRAEGVAAYKKDTAQENESARLAAAAILSKAAQEAASVLESARHHALEMAKMEIPAAIKVQNTAAVAENTLAILDSTAATKAEEMRRVAGEKHG